jgi:hypothetical protein
VSIVYSEYSVQRVQCTASTVYSEYCMYSEYSMYDTWLIESSCSCCLEPSASDETRKFESEPMSMENTTTPTLQSTGIRE